jgi:hypothetical protein
MLLNPSYTLAVDMLAPAVAPFVFKVFGIFIGTWINAHHDTAFVDA